MNVFGSWQDHEQRYANSMARAQRRYDDQMPPEDDEDECPECDGEGLVAGDGDSIIQCDKCKGKGKVCIHKWRFAGEHKDGSRFRKCVKCGESEEI